MKLVSAKVTAHDFLSLPEDGKRYELIEGDVYMTPSPLEIHQRLVIRLGRFLDEYLENHPLARAYVAPFDVELDEANVFQPDVVVVLNEHQDRITASRIVGSPDLVIEILSPSTTSRDRNLKFNIYARTSVKEVWIIDPPSRAAEIYRLRANQYELAETVQYEGSFTTPLLPGLAISVQRLFR